MNLAKSNVAPMSECAFPGYPIGRHLACTCAERLRSDFNVFDLAGRRRNSKAVFTHAFEVEFDGLADFNLDLGNSCPRGDAAR